MNSVDASTADLFEAGFNHFFRAHTNAFGGDLVSTLQQSFVVTETSTP